MHRSPFSLLPFGILPLLLALLGPLTALAARTVVECRGPDGTISYRDRCPPSESKVGEKRLSNLARPEPSAQELASRNPVILYSVPNCDTCDLVRIQLQARGVPFSEKDASTDPVTQEELKSASGAVTVPTVVIGTQALAGYDRAALAERLTAAGYPAPPGATTAATPVTP